MACFCLFFDRLVTYLLVCFSCRCLHQMLPSPLRPLFLPPPSVLLPSLAKQEYLYSIFKLMCAGFSMKNPPFACQPNVPNYKLKTAIGSGQKSIQFPNRITISINFCGIILLIFRQALDIFVLLCVSLVVQMMNLKPRSGQSLPEGSKETKYKA